MKITLNKTKTTALLLLLTFAVAMPILLTDAHTPPWTIPTYAYVFSGS